MKGCEWGRMLLDNLRTARRNAGLTQKEAGKLSGLGHTTIGAYESYRAFPRFQQFFKLCEVYQVSPAEMFGGYLWAK